MCVGMSVFYCHKPEHVVGISILFILLRSQQAFLILKLLFSVFSPSLELSFIIS